MGDVGHKMLGKELKSRENRQKRLKSIGKTMRQLFEYNTVHMHSCHFAYLCADLSPLQRASIQHKHGSQRDGKQILQYIQ